MRSVFLLALFAVLACVTNEYTGERQLLFTSEAEEMALGVQAYSEMTGPDSGVATIEDTEWYASLVRVGEAIAEAADKPEFEWEFTLIDDPNTVNAWCLPGGKIAFYTGIYPILQDEAGMAIVMGHEVSHALLRHGGERISAGMLQQGLQSVAEISLSSREDAGLWMGALGVATQFGVMLPYGRSQETSADELGLELAAKAGYDPRAAIGIWERMGALGGSTPEFLSTHPNPGTRVENMREWMPDALALYEKSDQKQNRKLPSN